MEALDENIRRYNIFLKRYEQKYILTQEQYSALWRQAKNHMEADGYGHSTVCNLYYDTVNYDLIRSSIEHPVYKEKLRLRSYGVPDAETAVFLEIKKKYQGMVYKRRISLALGEAVKALDQGYIEPVVGQEQICAEMNCFFRRYELHPVVFLAYDREAFYEGDNSELRMTFDTNLRSRKGNLSLSQGAGGDPFFQNGEILLEIKTTGAYPFWLIHALEECGIYPASFSKYGGIYKRFLLPDFLEKLSVCGETAAQG